MAYPPRKLGKTDITGNALGFGCMSLSSGFYTSDVNTTETAKTLAKALDLGATFLSTADFYCGMKPTDETYANLKVLGSVLKSTKHKPVVCMKWGPWIEPGKGFVKSEINAAECKRRVEEACKILHVDVIDVLIYRSGSPGASIEECAKAMKAVLDAGKIRAVGVSEISADELRTINSIVPVSAIELECSLFARDSFKELVPAGREIGASFFAYSPLGRGLLTDNFDVKALPEDDFRRQAQPRFSDENLSNNQKLALRVKEMAVKKGCTSGQLALAWVLGQGDDFIPIPGTKRISNLEENFKALDIKLSKAEVDELSSIIPADEIAGGRY